MNTRTVFILTLTTMSAALLIGCTTAQPTDVPMAVSSQACDSASPIQALLLDPTFATSQILGGGTLHSGDFDLEAYLYCDPGLQPNASDLQARTAIEGLGIHTAWRYNGQQVPGDVELMWGYGPNPPPSGGWSGGLTAGSSASHTGGLQDFEIPVGTPVQVSFAIQATGVRAAASLTFYLVPATDGYTPTQIQFESLP